MKKEMKHTPGEWKVGRHLSTVVTDDPSAIDLEKRDTPDSLKYYGGALICESCRAVDVKLIAAAPDLLDALMVCYASLCTYGSHPIIEKQVLKAINKATK